MEWVSEWSSEFAVYFYSSLHDYVIHELKGFVDVGFLTMSEHLYYVLEIK